MSSTSASLTGLQLILDQETGEKGGISGKRRGLIIFCLGLILLPRFLVSLLSGVRRGLRCETCVRHQLCVDLCLIKGFVTKTKQIQIIQLNAPSDQRHKYFPPAWTHSFLFSALQYIFGRCRTFQEIGQFFLLASRSVSRTAGIDAGASSVSLNSSPHVRGRSDVPQL